MLQAYNNTKWLRQETGMSRKYLELSKTQEMLLLKKTLNKQNHYYEIYMPGIIYILLSYIWKQTQ